MLKNHPRFHIPDSLDSRLSPAQLFQSLLAPQAAALRLADLDCRQEEKITLPSLGPLKYKVWRGILFAVPPRPPGFLNCGERNASVQDLGLLDRWLGTSGTLSGLFLDRNSFSSKIVVESARQEPGFNSTVKLISSRQASQDAQLDSIVINVNFTHPSSNGSFCYSADRSNGTSGRVALKCPKGKVEFDHTGLTQSGDQGQAHSRYFDPKGVLAKLLSLYENPAPLAEPRNGLNMLGFSETLLQKLF